MAKTGKPNILFIMADDIGWFNLSCYNHGVMGYRTPNMDRIAREGAMFTDFSERIGRETVTYVSNIYKYDITYRLVIDQQNQRKAAKAEVGKPK